MTRRRTPTGDRHPLFQTRQACTRGTRRIIHLNTAYLKPPIAALRKHWGGLSCSLASRHDVYRGAGIADIRDIYDKVVLDEKSMRAISRTATCSGKAMWKYRAAGLVVQTGKRPLKIQVSKSLRNVLVTGVDENAEAQERWTQTPHLNEVHKGS